MKYIHTFESFLNEGIINEGLKAAMAINIEDAKSIFKQLKKKADEDNSSKAAEALAKIENQFFTSQNNGYFFDNIHKYISSGYFFSDIKRIETNINQVEIRLAKIFLPTS